MESAPVPRVIPLVRGTCLGLLAWAVLGAAAQAEPPIKNARDAQCRDVARTQVFSTPDPQNLGLHEVGRRIYQSCMKGGGSKRGRRRGRR